MIPYRTVSYYWLPLVGGTYQHVPAGGWQWVTDTAAPFANYSELVLPTWMPQKVYVTRCMIGYGCSAAVVNATQFTTSTDSGLTYSTSVPSDAPTTLITNVPAVSSTGTILTPYNGNTVEMQAFVDPGGKYYNAASGAEQPGAQERIITLAHCPAEAARLERMVQREFNSMPVLWDRGTDKLIAGYWGNSMLDWVMMELHFLVPDGGEPLPLGNGY